jgi:tRNA 2-thiouridine synthesizing protein E
MSDILKAVRERESDPERLDRREQLLGWSRESAEARARQDGIALTQSHWRVIEYLRRSCMDRGLPREARSLASELDTAFASHGGRRWLYELFPQGPVHQGCAIAGLPVPDHSAEEASGTAY